MQRLPVWKRRSLPADRCPFVSERNHFIRKYIYLATASQVTEEFCHYENRTFLIAGQTDYHNFHESCVVLMVGRQEQFAGIMNSAQQVFEKYREWDRKAAAFPE